MESGESTSLSTKGPDEAGGANPHPPMSMRTYALLVGAVSVVAVVLFATVVTPLLIPPPPAPAKTETVYLTISAGPGGEMAYSPTNFTVHTGDDVKLIITNHDTTTSPAPPLADSVTGTLDSLATYKLGPTAPWTNYSYLFPTSISHTFSIDFGDHVLNVPVPPATSADDPSVVVFEYVFSHSGTYTWYCDALCQGLPMTAPGPMAGIVNVA